MFTMNEAGIRGGISQISHRHDIKEFYSILNKSACSKENYDQAKK
eukprot:gene17558-36083_t